MMVLSPRKENLRQVLRSRRLMRGFAEPETNNLKTSLIIPCRGLKTIVNYIASPS